MARLQFGPYETIKRLGAGATAEVFLAAGPRPSSDELVALKVLLEHLASKADAVASFMREARTSSLLRHPNLVEVYEVAETNEGRPYIAMELVRGWSVSALNKKLRAAGKRLEVDAACELIRQAALGLHFAHQATGRDGEMLGLVHRDVSPQNVMVTEGGIAKVVDFGLAKATLQQETATHSLKGKIRYMPPEQLKSQPIDRRADVFALGAVLWELSCGVPLYPGASEAEVFQQALFVPQPHPDEIAKGLPRALVEVLQRAVERDAAKRTPTCAALAESLAPLSSPDAREKLSAHIKAHFESYPRTAVEARGGEAPSPIPVGSTGGYKRRGAVLAPPKTSSPPPSPPVPFSPDERERKTEAMTIPAGAADSLDTSESADATNPGATTGAITHPGLGDTRPGLPLIDVERDSSSTLSALTDSQLSEHSSPSHTRPEGFSPLHTIADEDGPSALLIKPPSRRLLVGAGIGAVVLVLTAAVVGRALRSTDEPDEPANTAALEAMLDERLRDAGMAPRAQNPALPVKPESGATVDARPATGFATKRAGPRGTLELTSSEPALVRERNTDLGVTPLTLSVVPGRHRLSFATADGSRSAELDVTVPANTTVKRAVKLK